MGVMWWMVWKNRYNWNRMEMLILEQKNFNKCIVPIKIGYNYVKLAYYIMIYLCICI